MRLGRLVLAVVAALAIIAVIALVYFYVSSGSGEASQPISAPTLDIAAQPTAVATEPAGAATAEATAETAGAPAALFALVQGESSVSFELDEDMRGQRITVVGTTPDVAGQIAVNFENPSASEVGEIRFNLRTLATNNDFRNRAIRGQILQSAQDQFEFGSFTPTAISGLPAGPIEAGQPVTFQITGDLTLKDIANPVTFDVTLSEVGEERLVGQATATVNRTDWGLTIPDVPGIANVEEEVVLTITIVAAPVPAASAGTTAEATAEAAEAPAATAQPTEAPTAAAAAPVVFNIVPGDSTVSFELDEDLRGQRTTVIGTTPDVAGQIAVNFTDPTASQVGEIRFNLRTLATDNDMRNRAIRGQILQSAQDQFEFGSFTPTAFSGLPAGPIEPGQAVTFQITGDLTLKDISNPVTFDVTLSEVSEDRLVGQATATVNRTDWGLTIPSVQQVANVEEEVVLTINLVASPEQ